MKENAIIQNQESDPIYEAILHQVERKLKNEKCDLNNQEQCITVLKRCVLPIVLIAVYKTKYGKKNENRT